jgi:hypothetical protein
MAEVHPDHGSVDGGYEVTIIGENFPTTTTVLIANTSVDVQSRDSGRRLTFTMPAVEEPGPAYLIVEGGGSDTGLEFTFEESSTASQSPTSQADDSTANADSTATSESTAGSDSTTEAPEDTAVPNEPTDQPTDATDEPS